MLKDIKEVNRNQERGRDAKREFAKQCYSKHVLPKPNIVVQSRVKEEMYALTNTIINSEQLESLASILKIMEDTLRELCLSNNNTTDKQFSDLLQLIVADETLREDLQRITYSHNNELGPKSVSSLEQLIRRKSLSSPLTHLYLINCKQRPANFSPIFTSLQFARNQIKTLALPNLQLDDEGFSALCSLINSPSALTNLDLSWNRFTAQQVKDLLESLGQNVVLESLNLAMTAIKASQKVTALMQFIRQNKRLLHLNVSGVLQTEEQVRLLIKSISKSETLLALHLSHTQIIAASQPLQAYILTKLRMQQVVRRKRNKVQPSDNAILKQKLSKNWLERDNLKAECQ